MDPLIQWSNANTGFLMALLTAIYVFATIWIVFESRRSNRLSERVLKDRSRPHIVVWIDAKQRTSNAYFSEIEYWIHMKNEGATTAHSVSVRSTPELVPRRGFDNNGKPIHRAPSFLQTETSVLVPKQTISESMGPSKFMFEDNSDDELKFRFSISYNDIEGSRYSNAYEIDLAPGKNHFIEEDRQSKIVFELIDNVKTISQSLGEIHRTLDQPDRSNLFSRWDSLRLTENQQKLLESLVESDSQSGAPGRWWMLRQAIGSTTVQPMADSGEEIVVVDGDIEALCQQGSLVGYYSHGTLRFRVAT